LNKIKQFLIYFFIFIYLCSFAYSAPPFQTTQTISQNIQIVYPPFEYYPFDKDIEFEFHVDNYNGSVLTNSSINCRFHLYNNVGEHIYQNNNINTMEANGIDWEVVIGKNNFSLNNNYAYIFACNNSKGIGGIVKAGFGITKDAKPIIEDNTSAYILFLVLFGMVLIIFFISNNIKTNNVVFSYILRRLLWVVCIVMFWFNFTLLRQYITQTRINLDTYLRPYWFILTEVTFMAIICIVYYMIVGSIKMLKESQQQKVNGEE